MRNLVKAMGRHLKNHVVPKVKRVRWRYLSGIAAIVGVTMVIFEYHFLEHLFIAMGLETTLHHLAVLALGEKTSEVASEVASEIVS